jgi:hypothetical protein
MRVGMGTLYQDNSLIMVSLHRPLPGVRLGELRKCRQEQGTTAEHRYTGTTCFRMRMAHLTTRSVLFRRPRY